MVKMVAPPALIQFRSFSVRVLAFKELVDNVVISVNNYFVTEEL